jgi:hypothetical protein
MYNMAISILTKFQVSGKWLEQSRMQLEKAECQFFLSILEPAGFLVTFNSSGNSDVSF